MIRKFKNIKSGKEIIADDEKQKDFVRSMETNSEYKELITLE